ncbi:MAG: class I SAM-dependent methyltransferase [Candidatus Ranarchaeia archaeon]|jgi:ubiquinone/menaquinone biosynthesis C-methylase UbiE
MTETQMTPSYGYYARDSTILLLLTTIIGITLFALDVLILRLEWMGMRWLFWLSIGITIFGSYHSLAHIIGVHIRLRDNDWLDMEFIAQKIQLQGHERVLDIGCGTGRFGLLLAKHLTSGRLVGIDIYSTNAISTNSLLTVQRNAECEGVRNKCEFKFGNALDIPFPDNSFDIVSAGSVLHMFQKDSDRKKVAEEVYRVLKPGGHFVTVEWDRNLRNSLVFGVFILFFFYTRSYWMSLFEKTKFSNIHANYSGPRKMTLYSMQKAPEQFDSEKAIIL